LHLTFDLSVNLDEVRILVEPNLPPAKIAAKVACAALPPDFVRAVGIPQKCNLAPHFEPRDEVKMKVSRKTTYSKKTLYKYSSEFEREIWSRIEENQFLTKNKVLRKKDMEDPQTYFE
jgi:hypothetical protein